MDILITGNLNTGTAELCRQLMNGNKLVFAAANIKKDELNKEAISFSFDPIDPMFEKLFKSYSFGVVIFFADRRECKDDNQAKKGSVEDLGIVLNLCRENKISQVIYVTSSEVYSGNETISEKTKPVPASSAGRLLICGEFLCDFFRESGELKIVTIHIPYLYSSEASDGFLTHTIENAAGKNCITLPGTENQFCDFLKDTDLIGLIVKIINEGADADRKVINVGTRKPITFGRLAQLLVGRFEKIKIEYLADERGAPSPLPVETASEYYAWSALHELESEFGEIANNTLSKAKKMQKAKKSVKKSARRRIFVQVIEIILGFILMEYLNEITETSVLFRFVDFRLLFVIVLGSVHGMFTGVIAAVLACISCLRGYSGQVIEWQMLFYNINNWLPFIAYIVAGVVTGYKNDKSGNALRFQKEQQKSVEEQYLFLYELNEQTQKHKEQYKEQLLGYRDSIGRLYSVTQKLDTVISDEVFKEAVNILEDVLDNRTIAIYTVAKNGNYARLAVCSSGISGIAEKSIKLSKYDVMLKQMSKNEVWYNKDMLRDYPSYCSAVYDEDKLVAVIFINKAEFNQMTTYYLNLVKVLSGLVQTSLVRAANFEAATEDQNYISGTNILKNEKFSSVYSVKKEMKEDHTLDYILLRVDNTEDDLVKLGSMIERGIRETDVAGIGDDGNIYLILPQAAIENLGSIIDRLGSYGVQCHHVSEIEPSAVVNNRNSIN